MKYGLIIHNYGNQASQAAGFNIGDPIQSIILKDLYDEMGIQENQIQKIDMCDIQTYDGDYVLLPMLSVALGVGYAPLPLSPKIIPIFISSHFVISELNDELIEYLRCYAPIGCRDEYSLRTMQKYHIPAYLFGCITVLFEKEEKLKGEKVYFIDIPDTLKEYIPDFLLKDAVIDTHLLPLKKGNMSKSDAIVFYELAERRLQDYYKNARLVVSSRMHAIVPCMAMGIPVIAVFENLSYRFSWLDKFIPLYTKEKFDQINWSPSSVEMEKDKETIKSVAIQKINEAFNKYNNIYDLSMFYENRNKALYGNKHYYAIKSLNLNSDEFTYVIWGCGLIGNNVYDVMQKQYPKAHLVAAIDEYVDGFWHGVKVHKAKDLVNIDSNLILLATYSGKEQGYSVMEKLGKVENKDFIYLGTING